MGGEILEYTQKAYAKLNLCLDICSKRQDGYHNIQSVFTTVSLFDEVTLTTTQEGIEVTCGALGGENNICYFAAKAFFNKAKIKGGCKIDIKKHIPLSAGLGGGSADAAAVLCGLNQLWHTGLSPDELETLGLRLGADVPFCLHGGLSRVTGIGETIRSFPCSCFYWLVLVQPCRGLSTGEVFTAWAESENIDRPDNDRALAGILSGPPSAIAPYLGNVLQSVSVSMRPEIGEAIACLHYAGAAAAFMTGSGSAVFGLFSSAVSARSAEAICRKKWHSVFMCHTRNESVLITDSRETC